MSSEKKDTRTKILEATWNLLEGGKGAAVSMSDIAKKVGVSRQAVYLHFPSRAELLTETTHYIDVINKVDQRLVASRTATSGVARLEAFIEAAGNYIPLIFGVAKALDIMRESDDAARAAWDDRMDALRHGCQAAIDALEKDGQLNATYTTKEATDVLASLIAIRNWEYYRITCGWSQKRYVVGLQTQAKAVLVNAP
tara:strand:+ start:16998 stop:17588 length:591 start_codon:yes stop_codon:yes gene_type:complete